MNSSSIEFICGIHSVQQALRARKREIINLIIEQGKRNEQISHCIILARKNNARIIYKPAREMDRLSSKTNHQGVILAVKPLDNVKFSKVKDEIPSKNELWIAVDEINDPHNLGAIIRSAVCFGASAVLIPGHRSAGISPAVHKTASGAVEHIKIIETPNLNNSLIELKRRGFWVYGADMCGKPLPDAEYNLPMVLVIGSEDKGIRHITAKNCDEIISIPQTGTVDSLNASCAASVILSDIYIRSGLYKK